ncbi:hypothetical protein [Parasitella parasitica]|uniref:Uncharacterized protein n=1 Tax=Parasitella parasitica TaxID=35722 RepID=A0A0B7N9S8_9FUNG|nr:hypothetical protein [Parasitella parasitica]
MEFASFGEVKNLVFGLPTSVFIVIVLDNHTKEQFKPAAYIYKTDFTLRVAKNMRQLDESSNSSAVKRIRTPSPANQIFDKQLEALLSSKSRRKYAILYPEDFIPIEIFQKFPKLHNGYKAVIDATPFDDNAINSADSSLSWRNVKKEKNPGTNCVSKYQKFEMIATGGGYYNNNEHNDMLGAYYLGVAAPFHMAQDTDLILFSPIIPQETYPAFDLLEIIKNRQS